MLLTTRIVEKVWGQDRLPPQFDIPEGVRIGEIWFEPPPVMPGLLVKYLFTSEKLSVQAHPGPAQAKAAGLGQTGKEECWVVIGAEEGATLGIGFDAPLSKEAMRSAALDGSIKDLMTWHDVEVGDAFFIPAGTVHAIGAGCTIVEVQQNEDITFRLYDYGRPRELHLDQGVEVSKGEVYDRAHHHRRIPDTGHAPLVEDAPFRLDFVNGVPDDALLYSYAEPLLVVPLQGEVVIGGEEIVRPGQCGYASEAASVAFAEEGKALVTAPA